MSEDKTDKSYGLEPTSHEPPEPPKQPAPAEPPEPPEPPEPSKPAESSAPAVIKALDVCPNCGSPMGGADAVVCLRCGFDLKSLKVLKVETGETFEPESEPDEEVSPLCEPGAADPGLPLAMAVGGLGLLTLGYLMAAGGLVEATEDGTAGLLDRLGGLFKMLVRTGALTLAGLGGLSVLAHMLNTRIGNVKVAAIRMLGIFAVIGLLTFFNARSQTVEWTIELVCQALAFMGLATVLFKLAVRDAATLMGFTVFSVIGLLLLSALVQWAASF